RGYRARTRGDPRRNQDGRGQSRLPGPRDFHPEFLEGSSSRQTDSRHPRHGQEIRTTDRTRRLRPALRSRQPDRVRRRTPEPRSFCRSCFQALPAYEAFQERLPFIATESCFAHHHAQQEVAQQVQICVGVPSHPLAHENRYASYILNTLLGGGMSSRLFQNIRERQGLAYAIYSDLNPYRDTGCLCVYAGTSKESAAKVVQSVVSEFRKLKSEEVPEEELRRAKDQLKGSLMLSLESSTARMSNLARQEMYFDRFFTLDELIEKIEGVTADDLRAMANDFF